MQLADDVLPPTLVLGGRPVTITTNTMDDRTGWGPCPGPAQHQPCTSPVPALYWPSPGPALSHTSGPRPPEARGPRSKA